MGLETVELILLAEEHFEIRITDESSQFVTTVADFIDLIHQVALSQRDIPIDKTDISDWLVEALIREFAVKPEHIHTEARFIQDLGLD